MATALRPGIVLLALICGLPLSFMAVYGLPWMVAASVAMLATNPSAGSVYGIAFVVACLFSLATYWRLAFATAVGRRFKFGIWFWLAIACAALTAYEFNKWFGGPEAFLLLVSPIVLSTIYFVYRQRAAQFRVANEA